MQSTHRASRLPYYFEDVDPPGFFAPPELPMSPPPSYRNPVALAREWKGMLATGECATRADLARRLGVTRARVTQVLGLLALAPEALQALAALGDPLPRPIVPEHRLRLVLTLPAIEQKLVLRDNVGPLAPTDIGGQHFPPTDVVKPE